MEANRRAEPLKQVAASFNISYDTLLRAAKAGRVKTIRFGKRLLIPALEIERLSQEGLAPRTSQGR
ncbi:MAG TPA: hypothetical protein VMU57_02910 [Edaphobacter sp.]|uniref:hypothetical protein n=1 Tax=Edaphobacter sp. TaxID=1934404 RepID=UPI002C201565|nr:hypothetical protein [Edaphobacter sp.]HUZ93841.1 hypothetical protein [Edaphobacter sp.]